MTCEAISSVVKGTDSTASPGNQDQDAGHSGEDTPPATPTIAVAQSARLPAHEPQRTEQSVAGVQAVNDPAPGVLVVTGPADAANSLAGKLPPFLPRVVLLMLKVNGICWHSSKV